MRLRALVLIITSLKKGPFPPGPPKSRKMYGRKPGKDSVRCGTRTCELCNS
jgi:hypothetical protein